MKLLNPLARRLVHRRLDSLRAGSLLLRDRRETRHFGEASSASPTAEVVVHSDSFYPAVAFGGHIGAAESYMAGDWESSDLTAVIRLFLRNREALDGLEKGWARIAWPARDLFHLRRRNSRAGSRKNIHAHYDMGNDLFRLFLDETMTYSSGIFERDGVSMMEASIAKYDRICRKLALAPGDRVIEIGSGWGGFAIFAASRYGVHVTTTTISEQQFALASERIRSAGLEDRIELLLSDYRDLRGNFDSLVSIEMIEAVGHDYYREFFTSCASLLRPGGSAVIQAITVPDSHYEAARREVDFIKRYIFPGSNIPSEGILSKAAAGAGLGLAHRENFAPHYAETLRRWWTRFEENWSAISALGYDERFRRLWHFYLAYCEGGFDEGALGLMQLHFEREEAGVHSLLREKHSSGEEALRSQRLSPSRIAAAL